MTDKITVIHSDGTTEPFKPRRIGQAIVNETGVDEELAYRLKKFFDNRIHKEEADIKVFTPYKEKLDNIVGMSVDEFNSFLNVLII